ncbi:hypothetical protein BBO99_00002983 [Phytophthora kernoviae]|uniref:Cleavage/polyadenylation specificity factor A subunit N-terminal domain-containing protein n=2 Tax=Phytophthora kernoviae TaxID=325452 RepID=A0A421GV91_9STRA|nr:hypothetical protein G195_003293 [Phytophthora kernoviae 00238/432]KAG2526548.1 hypothetical protein JM16_002719 [Phytophthora kernoviae]KAG2528136.1 hypothetical protein JM18_003379 [Phytophthora kernoviae]RLN02503.1 hypothetical protein BBI17_003099 [Phytophthora kernoviae]RLN82362.1 hypothetical protein BBO99_00002983 [Phytophthora kernoviae]
MQVDRTLIDKDFDRYVLATDGVTKHITTLPTEVLIPLDAGQSMRKAQWESRVHYNALSADPFLSKSFGASVAYFVNAEYELMQVVDRKTDGTRLEKVFSFPILTGRQENVTLQVAGKSLVVYCDGHGTLHFLKAESDQLGAKWSVIYECAPWGVMPLLLLGASYDELDQHIHAVVAQPLVGSEADGSFRKESISSSQDRPLEVPTAESILSGFEECDNGDPNAKAVLLLVSIEQKVVQEQLDIDCRNFQFLCPSAGVDSASDFSSTLLFRNDVHGLIYELSVAVARLKLRQSATLPAFGFVQASKQEKKFMTFHPLGSLACIGEFERLLFVYQGRSSPEELKSHTRKQHVVELGNQQLLGLRIVNDDTILVLTSTELYSIGVPVQP